ncbi:hypothetical protein [Frigoriglobus tundricola]|uniref:DNA primase/polymerase bifunctional N-terminal domain-containing protein n=1 Tax=Frigoriglobus tundricola TaxID=2774151 RepID=A0A6M5YEZ0_9BACT|nr:hypothetical protein [Frigoriglobus tundricola]QJW92577.1 hypothetical protein FTUN_0073 [Frigoriglobus tundricola]
MTIVPTDSSDGQPRPDPAANLWDRIDPAFAPAAPDWHRGFDGAPHVTAEAAERLAADLVSAARRGWTRDARQRERPDPGRRRPPLPAVRGLHDPGAAPRQEAVGLRLEPPPRRLGAVAGTGGRHRGPVPGRREPRPPARAPSGGLVDVDLDCPEARRAAPGLLPRTEMLGGRTSAPNAHYFFVTNDPPAKASDKFRDPCARATANLLLELRSTGGQTVVAPSVYGADPAKGHPEPEAFMWWRRTRAGPRGRRGAPDRRPGGRRGRAPGAVLAERARHDAALALAGGPGAPGGSKRPR